MVSIPEAFTIHLTYGAVEHGQWCDEHQLSHRSRAKVYGLTDGGSSLDCGEVGVCDEDEP